MDKTQEFRDIVSAARTYFETRLALGEKWIVFEPQALSAVRHASALESREQEGRGGGVQRSANQVAPPSFEMLSGPLADEDSTRRALSDIEARVSRCTKCSLHRGRKQAVFGAGSGRTQLVFVGEAPGRDEDIQGKPFVGRAGQLLTRIVQAIHLQRSDVYITNVVKCRPEGNRDPLPEEVECCSPYLIEQLDILKPKAICALGRFAAEALSGFKLPMAAYRKQELSYRGIPLVATYHPAACLRNPDLKKLVWEDIQKLVEVWKQS